MKIAVEGCAHGELDKIYETIAFLEEQNNIKVDLLIICGDFQAVRNQTDLKCMAVPNAYKKMNTFYKYYSGEKTAPILTIFIGGNHEASNYLSELPFGGWVCPNIYYLGYANVINIGNLRIGGLSGIYKGHDYLKGRFEYPPYDESTKRSIYHIRNIDVFRLKQISEPIDIFISHDWPRGIYHYGNKNALLKQKSFFRDEIEKNTLGSRPAEELLHKLKPKYWFAAHLHCKFAAVVQHNSDEGSCVTKFLALDKCLPKRNFLQILDIGEKCDLPVELKYDPEWLCILQLTDHLLNVDNRVSYMPGPGGSERWDFKIRELEKKEIKKLMNLNFVIPKNFQITAPIHSFSDKIETPEVHINPQTVQFCQKLNVRDPLTLLSSGKSLDTLTIREFINDSEMNITINSQSSINPDEINLDSDTDAPSKNSSESDENIMEDFQPITQTEDVSKLNSDVEDFNNSFFIDKIGSNDMLDSPKNKCPSLQERKQLHLQYCETPEKVTKLMNFPEIKVDQNSKKNKSDNDDDMTTVSCSKKFKRRNQEIYGTKSDEDENQSMEY
ncbi:lariat debranching enzyme-like [Centruroides sculpturatus]|uniref:lariat debranching enzyme-like n=1 Tax=Centruroides sculpturatus TaxID=218467 RepID=UPI000C6ECF36|nr:lariat debranching enzyme-like [Centruroides sculpturatus]